jgi:small subunit ribosomal protein S18
MNARSSSRGTGRNTRERKRREPRSLMGKQKSCSFCDDKSLYVDYRDTKRLQKFVSEQGKMLNRRTSGVCSLHQRQLVKAVKYARHLAMIPFVADMTK